MKLQLLYEAIFQKQCDINFQKSARVKYIEKEEIISSCPEATTKRVLRIVYNKRCKAHDSFVASFSFYKSNSASRVFRDVTTYTSAFFFLLLPFYSALSPFLFPTFFSLTQSLSRVE